MKKTVLAAAITAALASAGTASAAAVITSADIKDRTIRTIDIAPSTRTALRGQEGPAGPAGPAGPQGEAGTSTTFTRRKGGMNERVAYCAPGETAVGGGGRTDGVLMGSQPVTENGVEGWRLYIQGGNTGDADTFVICAR